MEQPIIMVKIDGRLFFEDGKPSGFVPLNPFMLCIDLAKANERHHLSMNDGILLFYEGVGRFGRVAECYRMEEPTTFLHYGFRLWTRIDGQEVMEIISKAEK